MAKTDYNTVIQASQDNIRLLREKLDDLDKLHRDILSLKNDTGELPIKFNKWYADFVKINENYREVLSEANKKYVDTNNEMFTSSLEVFNQTSKNTFERLEAENKNISTYIVTLDNIRDDFTSEVQRLKSIDLEEHFAKHNKALSDISGSVNLVNNSIGGLASNVQNNNQAIIEIQNKTDMLKGALVDSFQQKFLELSNETKKVDDAVNRIEAQMDVNSSAMAKKFNILLVLVILGMLVTVGMILIPLLLKLN